MKKRIAVFVNGWGSDYLQEILHGICGRANSANVDIFAFVNYSAFAETNSDNNYGEMNIFTLPKMEDFDGAIVMANSFNMQEEIDYVSTKLTEAGIPAISIEYDLEGFASIGSDNYSGMYDLAEHMIQVHNVKNIVYIGGPRGHQESSVRLQAVKDVARENNVELPSENILYSDWAVIRSQELMKEWFDEHKVLPDVVICANDVMAKGICEWFMEQGYKVPEDVKVTGYDCVRIGREFEPAITTVTHRWNEMGDRALRLLLEKMGGKEVHTPVVMKTGFVCGESCGCQMVSSRIELQARGRMALGKRMDALRADSHFRHIYLAVRKVETVDDCSYALSHLFASENWMVGRDFMICLEPQFFYFEENDENLRMQGYSEKMDVVCALKDGEVREHQVLNRREAMFRVAQEKEEAGIYIFVPIHTEGKTLGFAMLTRDADIAEDNYLYIFTRHINQYMEQIRRNIKLAELTKKLTELSVTDVLTGVYNRAGCEKLIYPFLQECQQTGGQGIVMIADVDRMKTINDKFGHGNGDLALRIVSAVLKEQLPSGFVVARFGGDEFFIAGRSSEGVSVDSIIEDITRQLAAESARRQIPFELTVSLGGITMEKGEPFVLEKCLQKADEYMYAAKRKRHAQIDGIALN